jgi:two-component system response regulator PilR (NtrC family)
MAKTMKTILVVDDELDLLNEIAGYLRRRGHNVLVAATFGEGVRVYVGHADSIALVLTDGRMPDGNGIDLVRLVAERSRGACCCMLMTGHLEVGVLDTDLKAVGVRVLQKPFGFADLYAAILEALPTDDKHRP